MFIVAVFLLLVGVAAFFAGRAIRADAKRRFADAHPAPGAPGLQAAGTAALIGGLSVAVAALLLGLLASVTKVGSGEVGIVRGFGGNIIGQVGPGVHLVAPWDNVATVETRVQHAEFDHLLCFSKETQDVYLDVTLNYSVSPTDVQDLIGNYGTNWYEVLVPSRVLNDAKDVTVQFAALDEAPHREDIRRQIALRLTDELGRKSIHVESVQVKNISFTKAFQQAIDERQVAQQKAQQAQFQAQQAVATAKGEAQSTLIQAKAQATANRDLARSITPTLVQYQLVQKLAPTITTIAPSTGLFNLGKIAGSGGGR